MTKKLGPLPVWAWVVVAAVGGYIIYRMRAAQAEPEPEGYYPAERREPNEGEPSGSGGGVAQLGEEIGALREAGFVPAGSEEAKGEREVEPSFFEELAERLIGERLAGGGGGGKGKRGKRGKQGGKGKRGKQGGRGKAGGRGKRGGGKRAPSSKNPRHTHQPSHTPSRHPKTRIGVGPGRPARKAPPRPRPRAGAGGGRRRRR